MPGGRHQPTRLHFVLILGHFCPLRFCFVILGFTHRRFSFRIFNNGWLVQSSRITVIGKCNMAMDIFPFDVHVCSMTFGSFAYKAWDKTKCVTTRRKIMKIAELFLKNSKKKQFACNQNRDQMRSDEQN